MLRILGIVLLFASFSKAREICVGCPYFCIWDSCVATFIASGVEGIAGAFLLVRKPDKTSWFVAAFLFSTFLLASLAELIFQKESCNCFGRLAVSPIAMVFFDSAVLLMLVFCGSFDDKNFQPVVGKQTLVGIIGFFVVWGSLLISVQFEAANSGGVLLRGRYAYLRPKQWVSKPLQVVDRDLAITDMSSTDLWTGHYLFLQNGCEDCASTIISLNRNIELHHDSVFIVFFPSNSNFAKDLNSAYQRVFLSSDQLWITDTPLSLEVKNGLVISVSFSFSER